MWSQNMAQWHQASPVNEDLANLDAFAARPQSIFKSLAAANDADAAQFFGKVYANVSAPCWCSDALLREWKVPQTGFNYLQATAS